MGWYRAKKLEVIGMIEESCVYHLIAVQPVS